MVLKVQVLPHVPSCIQLPAETKETKNQEEGKEAGLAMHMAHIHSDFWVWISNVWVFTSTSI